MQITLRASSDGQTSGVAVLASGSTTLVVTVLPKVWREGQRRLVDVGLAHAGTAFTTLHEGDALRLRGSPSLISAVVTALTEAHVTDLGAAGTLLQVAAIDASDFGLVAGEGAGHRSLLDFVGLLERTRFAIGDQRVSATGFTHPALRVLLHRRFLATLEPLLKDVRPRYVETEHDLATPRGRLLDRNLVLHAQTGWPKVMCRFDEQTYDTPLLRVIRAALHAVAHASAPAQLSELAVELRKRAVLWVRALAQVQLLDRRRAVHIGATLRLSRLEQPWAEALALALQVLTEDSAGMAMADDSIDAYELLVPTAKLWEQIVADVLARMEDVTVRFHSGQVDSGDVAVLRPWRPLGRSPAESPDLYPDFLLTVGDQVWCLDAKYKATPRSGPSSGDAYQLFTYSHLASVGGRAISDCGLIYPGGTAAASVYRLFRAPDDETPLLMCTLPFPASPETRSRATWDSYLRRSASQLSAVMREHRPTQSLVA